MIGGYGPGAVPVAPLTVTPPSSEDKVPEPIKGPKGEKKKSLTPDSDDKKSTEGTNDAVTAKIVVTLPADAKLYFNNVATHSLSNRREFQSPELVPGLRYEYTVKAELKVDGKTEIKTAKVEVKAGQVSNLNFAFPVSVAAK